MQIRSFRGSGEPVWVNAHLLSARDCLGPDPRIALGPAATPAASTGRTRDRTRPMLQKCQKVLAIAPSTRDPTRTWRAALIPYPVFHALQVYQLALSAVYRPLDRHASAATFQSDYLAPNAETCRDG